MGTPQFWQMKRAGDALIASLDTEVAYPQFFEDLRGLRHDESSFRELNSFFSRFCATAIEKYDEHDRSRTDGDGIGLGHCSLGRGLQKIKNYNHRFESDARNRKRWITLKICSYQRALPVPVSSQFENDEKRSFSELQDEQVRNTWAYYNCVLFYLEHLKREPTDKPELQKKVSKAFNDFYNLKPTGDKYTMESYCKMIQSVDEVLDNKYQNETQEIVSKNVEDVTNLQEHCFRILTHVNLIRGPVDATVYQKFHETWHLLLEKFKQESKNATVEEKQALTKTFKEISDAVFATFNMKFAESENNTHVASMCLLAYYVGIFAAGKPLELDNATKHALGVLQFLPLPVDANLYTVNTCLRNVSRVVSYEGWPADKKEQQAALRNAYEAKLAISQQHSPAIDINGAQACSGPTNNNDDADGRMNKEDAPGTSNNDAGVADGRTREAVRAAEEPGAKRARHDEVNNHEGEQ